MTIRYDVFCLLFRVYFMGESAVWPRRLSDGSQKRAAQLQGRTKKHWNDTRRSGQAIIVAPVYREDRREMTGETCIARDRVGRPTLISGSDGKLSTKEGKPTTHSLHFVDIIFSSLLCSAVRRRDGSWNFLLKLYINRHGAFPVACTLRALRYTEWPRYTHRASYAR